MEHELNDDDMTGSQQASIPAANMPDSSEDDDEGEDVFAVFQQLAQEASNDKQPSSGKKKPLPKRRSAKRGERGKEAARADKVDRKNRPVKPEMSRSTIDSSDDDDVASDTTKERLGKRVSIAEAGSDDRQRAPAAGPSKEIAAHRDAPGRVSPVITPMSGRHDGLPSDESDDEDIIRTPLVRRSLKRKAAPRQRRGRDDADALEACGHARQRRGGWRCVS